MLFEFPRHTGARRCALFALFFLGFSAPGCLVDLNDRCGAQQHYDTEQANCACDADYALSGNECLPCGENETGSLDGCVCVDGFSRATPEAACEALAGLGQDCQSDVDCGDARYGHCRIEQPGEPGYCTAPDCKTSDDCPSDFGCNTRATPAFCERPPLGLGEPCSSSDECADYTASYCETVVAKSCVVNDCKPDPSKCYGDWVCCDIALLSQSLCIPQSQLEEGSCPAGGTLVPREE